MSSTDRHQIIRRHALSHHLWGRLWKNRNRLFFSIVLAYVAGYLLYAHFDVQVRGVPLPVFTGSVYAIIVLLAGIATTLALPRARTLIECAALSRICVAIGVSLSPVSGAMMVEQPFLNATVIVVGAAVINFLLYGKHAVSGGLTGRFILALTSWLDGGSFKLRPVRVSAELS